MSLRDHLEKVRYFQAVCDAGSFRKAALQLHLSQSSLTVAVKKLEGSVGGKLLVRTKRGVRLTAAGETLLAFARDLSFKVDDVAARLLAPQNAVAGRLRIGAYDSIAIYWLPRVLRHLHKQFPHLSLSVSIGSSTALIDQVKSGEADVAVVVEPPADSGLKINDLFRDRFSVFGAPSLRDPGYLIGMFSARLSAEQTLGDMLREKGVDLSAALDVESFEIAKSLALQEVGVAVLPHRVAELDGTGRRRLQKVKGLPHGFGQHRVSVVTLREADARSNLAAVVSRAMQRID